MKEIKAQDRYAYIHGKSLQLCPILCDPTVTHLLLCPWDSPGKNTGVIAISYSRGSSSPRDWTHVCYFSCLDKWVLSHYCHLGLDRCSGVLGVLLLWRASMGFPGCSDGKESSCLSGNLGWIPGLGRSPREGNGNPFQDCCLGNPMDRGACWATVHWVTKSRTWLSG